MANVSIIGAGTAGLILAYALLRDGHRVTVYSDRTADQWLNDSKPTGTAFLYGETIDIERELGMDHWTEQMFGGSGVLLDFKPTLAGDQRMVVAGSFGSYGSGVDMRMRVHRWMNDLEARGGTLVIESVTPDRADQIAAESDITILAAGKADLGRLIPRDAARSHYDRPQRHLAMAVVTGVTGWRDRVEFTPVKFNFYGDTGEYFWVPFTHKTHGPSWCVLWEARPGGAFDRFGECTSAQDVVDISRELIQAHAPWEWDAVKGMTAIEDDPHSWLVGRFPPTVREAFGTLPSGGLLMPVGDTAITFDPIGGQGGNNAQRMAKYVADRISAHTGPYDEAFMTSVNHGWWELHGKWAYQFNNLLLEPLEPAAGMLLTHCAQSRAFADQRFFSHFPRPHNFFPAITDPVVAQALIAGTANLIDGEPALPLAAE